MKRVFELTNKYTIIITILMLFWIFASIYLGVSLATSNPIKILISLLILFFMTSAFVSGWFNMIVSAVKNKYNDEPNHLAKEFFPGVGEYFLSSSGAIFILILLSCVVLTIAYLLGFHLIGDVGISAADFPNSPTDQGALIAFVKSLTPEQLTRLRQWNAYILCIMMANNFILMLYMPALFFKNKNPFIAIFIGLKDLFSRKFFKTLGIFAVIMLLNMFLSIFSALTGSNTVMFFITTLLMFYFATGVGVGIFYYYYQNFVLTPHLGSNIDTLI